MTWYITEENVELFTAALTMIYYYRALYELASFDF